MNHYIAFLIVLLVPVGSFGTETNLLVGSFEKNGVNYQTSLSSSKLSSSDKPFPVSYEEAERMVKKHLNENKQFGADLKITSMTLLSFKEGRILQVLVNSSLLSFQGGSPGPTIYYYITSSKELIHPRKRESNYERQK